MEKIKREYSSSYLLPRLFLQDIRAIAELFKKNCPKFEIVADEYKLTDICEIEDIQKEEIYYFKISSKNPEISLELTKNSAVLHLADSDNETLLGITKKIDNILNKRRSPWHILIWLILLPALLLSVLGFIVPFPEGMTFYVSSIVSLVLFYAISHYIMNKKYSVIFLCKFTERPNFFKRNKDKIILLIVGTFIGALFSGIAALVIKFLASKK